MPTLSSRKDEILPSLLDRITDDGHLLSKLADSKKRVEAIEKKLSKNEMKISKEAKQKLISELKNQRGQLSYLQQSSSALNTMADCVKRDLSWLFNAHNLCIDELLEENYPHIESSVLNYGMPDLTGRTASSINIYQLKKTIKQTILRFEPRIMPKTLKLKLHKEKTMMDHNALAFEIQGDLWADPVPIHMHLITQLDLENGNVEVEDM